MHTRDFDDLLYLHLRNPEFAREYLRLAREEGDDSYTRALRDIEHANKSQADIVHETKHSADEILSSPLD